MSSSANSLRRGAIPFHCSARIYWNYLILEIARWQGQRSYSNFFATLSAAWVAASTAFITLVRNAPFSSS